MAKVTQTRSEFRRFHVNYGLADSTRVAVLRDALARGVKVAASAADVSPSSVYRWRKGYTVADLMRR